MAALWCKMVRFPVTPKKEKELLGEMARLGIREADLSETFIRSGGKGGQKVNKSSSCVRLRHVPTGIEVKCRTERSQVMNRFFARRILAGKIKEALKIFSTWK